MESRTDASEFEILSRRIFDGESARQASRELARTMARSACAWLGELSDQQRLDAQWGDPRDSSAERERLHWFYTPTDHGGLALGAQGPRQQSLAMQLLASGLSRAAYVTVATIIGLENVLDELEGWSVDWGRERGRDPGLYWLRIFGDPGGEVWAWRFGGHHVSVNYLIYRSQVVSMTPSFLGADPACSPLLGPEATLTPLGGIESSARQLVNSLPPILRERAVIHPRAISDIVSGNRAQLGEHDRMMHMQDLWRGSFQEPRLAELVDAVDVRAEQASGYTTEDHDRLALTPQPKGLAGRHLDEPQRTLLRSVIGAYLSRAPAGLAQPYHDWFREDVVLDEVHFAWAGSISAGEPLYYRLQGPRVLVEYDNTQRQANHAHSVWRIPGRDFGRDVLARHRDKYVHHE